MKKVLIVGATSAIAEATARLLAQRGDAIFLIGRRVDALAVIAADLEVRGAAKVGRATLDANDLGAHEHVLNEAERFLGGLDTVLVAYGSLSDQKACEESAELTAHELMNNGVSVAALLMGVAARFQNQRRGTIAVISSVAGDRGRESNYVYGSAKALVTSFASGLRQRLRKFGVAVITIKPGFVDTPMTAAFRKGALWAKPQQVAAGIVRGIDRSSNVIYLPAFWRPIMFIIRAIPENLFARLTL
jgi:short-subunit dehydrogenase